MCSCRHKSARVITNELVQILLCHVDPMDQGFNVLSMHFYGNSSYLASMAMCCKGNQFSPIVCSSGALVSLCVVVFIFSHI